MDAPSVRIEADEELRTLEATVRVWLGFDVAEEEDEDPPPPVLVLPPEEEDETEVSSVLRSLEFAAIFEFRDDLWTSLALMSFFRLLIAAL